jgi:hypothetical protein
MRSSLAIAGLALVATAAFGPADPPYIGKWKVNPAKSDFGQVTVSYEEVAGGGYKTTTDGVSYIFRTDGKETPTPWGSTAAWTSIDATTWQTVSRANGKVFATDTVKISPDGKTMTIRTKLAKASGETSDEEMTFNRASGGPGLAGKWQAANLKSSAPGSVDIAAKGSDGLTLTFVDQNGVCDAKLDGKDVAATGPMWPKGWTCALSRHGENAFDLSWKKDGKPMYKYTYTASTDGKTLVEEGGAAAGSEKVKVLFDRQ